MLDIFQDLKGRRNLTAVAAASSFITIVLLFYQIMLAPLEKEMLETFKLLKRRCNLTAVAASIFVVVYRRKQPQISLKQILPRLNVTPPVTLFKLGATLKK